MRDQLTALQRISVRLQRYANQIVLMSINKHILFVQFTRKTNTKRRYQSTLTALNRDPTKLSKIGFELTTFYRFLASVTTAPIDGRISTTIALILSRPSIMLIDILLTSAGVGSTFKTLLFAYLFEFALAFYHLDSDFFPFIRLVTAILIVIIIFCHCRSAKLILRHFEIMF